MQRVVLGGLFVKAKSPHPSWSKYLGLKQALRLVASSHGLMAVRRRHTGLTKDM